jgi:ElaB/YqjD/DUF883 family membrane-anchored ribosome-binding protein
MDDTSRRVAAPGDETAARADDHAVASRTREIRHDIEHTREEISETIEAIGEKLRPRNIVASATDRVKSATTERVRGMTNRAGEAAGGAVAQARDAAGGLMEGIRQNPIPAALIAIGAGWLIMNRTQSGSFVRGARQGGPREYREYPDEYEDYREGSSLYRSPGIQTSAEIYEIDDAPGSESSVADATERIAARAREQAREAGKTVRNAGRRAQSRLERLTQENPLMAGAGALVLGAAVGLAIPESERENEWLGEARDSMVERAQEAARSAASRVEDAASKLVGSGGTGGSPE